MGTKRHFEVAGERVTVYALPSATEERVWQFREFMESDPEGVYGLDVETTGIGEEEGGVFDPDARIRLVQLGTATEAWVLDPHDPFWRDEIENALRGYDNAYDEINEPVLPRFVSHTNYDALWVRREFDINLGGEDRSIDTHTMTCLLDPGGRKDHTLKTWATKCIDDGLKGAEDELTVEFKRFAPVGQRTPKALKRWGFTNIPLTNPVYLKYAGLDAIYVRRLLRILADSMHSKKERALSRREQVVRRIADDMQWRGMRVDRERAGAVLDEIEREYTEADTLARDAFGFTPGSPRKVEWLAARGVEFTEHTPTGRGKLDKRTIPDLAAAYGDEPEIGPVLRALATMSDRKNILSNMRIIMRAADRDGFVHPSINTNQGVTGRQSVTKPAMQTFKKTDKRLRGCFIARDGRTFVGADYHSQEIRLAAMFSQDPNFLRIIHEGLSMHDVTAESMFGAKFTQDDRQVSKIYNFATQYNAGPFTIANQLGWKPNKRGNPNPRAKKLWYAWRNTYKGFVEWSEYMAELSVVVNPWGRRIPRDPWRPYANGNYMIQSSGRDLLGDALVKIREARHDNWIWLPIHDEIILEVPDDDETVKYAMYLLETSMFARIQGMEMTASAEHLGPRWSGEDKK